MTGSHQAVPASLWATAQPAAADGPMPVSIELRPDLRSQTGGHKAMLSNDSDGPLDVVITAISSTTQAQNSIEVTVPPRDQKNLAKEGFVIEPGDRVTLHSPPHPDVVIASITE
jgi:hypothetical protein